VVELSTLNLKKIHIDLLFFPLRGGEVFDLKIRLWETRGRLCKTTGGGRYEQGM
jgi:hypothetical protein